MSQDIQMFFIRPMLVVLGLGIPFALVGIALWFADEVQLWREAINSWAENRNLKRQIEALEWRVKSAEAKEKKP